ncbi:MAG: PIN domain-containing protein [Gemmatimonadota bacterium]|uniref:type II toxin-antitoxin system VapC family toxin n=1 Tax=Candidatus Palauibacter soopunensis TaxID=3056739 RepID=UPI002395FF84|nr:PIN domain-containing protein [Candidatus Palauibacter soopunensis]MDE2877500.1 PIN domain-containing protein [Candidatus Palauibacter soopunensis]MDE2944119.1 PIN domain-containing protein [Gemmatimonadota bacterium]
MADAGNSADLEGRLAGAGLVHVDARVFALHLSGRGSTRQTELAFSGIASGSIRAQTSSLTLYQILAEVYRQGKPAAARDVARNLRLYPRLDIVSASPEIAIQAAEVRAQLGGRPERALQIATALVSGAEVYLTSGSGLRRIAGMQVLNVEDFG